MQVCIELGGDLEGEALACITQRFPFARTIERAGDGASFERLNARLAALPDRSCPAVEVVSSSIHNVPAGTVVHVARLCPRLREVSCRALDSAELAAALEGLAPVAGTLEALELTMQDYAQMSVGIFAPVQVEPGALLPASEALGRLRSLRRLHIVWEHEPGPACLLAPALPSLSSLSSLEVNGLPPGWLATRLSPPLGVWPGSLREVTLYYPGMLGGLRALPHLGGVTKLCLRG